MLLPALILASVLTVALLLRDSIRHDRARRTRYGRRVILNDGFGPREEDGR